MAVVLIICFTLLYKTRYGRYIYAVGGNRNAAHVSGINTKRIICSVYILTGVLSALAGVIMTARVTSGVTSTGDGYETDAIAAVLLVEPVLPEEKEGLWGSHRRYFGSCSSFLQDLICLVSMHIIRCLSKDLLLLVR